MGSSHGRIIDYAVLPELTNRSELSLLIKEGFEFEFRYWQINIVKFPPGWSSLVFKRPRCTGIIILSPTRYPVAFCEENCVAKTFSFTYVYGDWNAEPLRRWSKDLTTPLPEFYITENNTTFIDPGSPVAILRSHLEKLSFLYGCYLEEFPQTRNALMVSIKSLHEKVVGMCKYHPGIQNHNEVSCYQFYFSPELPLTPFAAELFFRQFYRRQRQLILKSPVELHENQFLHFTIILKSSVLEKMIHVSDAIKYRYQIDNIYDYMSELPENPTGLIFAKIYDFEIRAQYREEIYAHALSFYSACKQSLDSALKDDLRNFIEENKNELPSLQVLLE